MREPKKRTVGLPGAISIGIGGMVGGGIFAVLGEAVSLAHGATIVAFLFAGMVALATSYSYAKFSVRYQNRGGTVVFIDNAFRHNLLSGSISFMLWLSYLVTISLYAVAFASYAQVLFNGNTTQWLRHILISLAILLPALINLLNASFVSRSETVIVMIKVALLGLIIVSGASFVDTERLSPANWGTSFSIIVAGMIIFVAYEGFELIANAAEEIKKPRSNLPRAFYSSILIVIVLYALIAVITVGTVPESQLLMAKDYALAVAARPALGQLGFTIVSVTALLATFSAINATIYGNARLGYIIAKKGELPKILREERRQIPDMGVIITLFLSLIIANTIDLTEIAIIGSASFLLIFFMVNISAWKLRKEIDANQWIIMMACLASGAALATLLTHTFSSNSGALLVFLSFMSASVLFEVFYGRLVRGHFFHRPYDSAQKGAS
ncbi:inner membrane transport protein YbaT [bacterium BMS3Abin01]|nr:inner membrane transport protein YbaT [bacterium BMS3Abin01]